MIRFSYRRGVYTADIQYGKGNTKCILDTGATLSVIEYSPRERGFVDYGYIKGVDNMSVSQSNSTLSKKEREQVLTNFGLQFIEVEPYVYKVLNTEKEVCINELQLELEESITLTSKELKTEKLPEECIWVAYYNIYYIFLDCENKEILKKYIPISRSEHPNTMILSHRQSDQDLVSIPTIYRRDNV